MSKQTKVEKVILESSNLQNRKFARSLRMIALDGIFKTAQEYGILQNPTSNVLVYETREHEIYERGGKATEELYGVGIPEHRDVDLSVDRYSRSLSTRYSPDRIGVQAERVSDGVYRDPITKRVYNWNEGFKTENGQEFYGGNVSLQTDLHKR
jgi:hypothetical protein